GEIFGPSAGEWLRRVLENYPQYDVRDKMSVLSIHIRAPAWKAVSRAAWWRGQFDLYPPLDSKPLWITEHGYSSYYDTSKVGVCGELDTSKLPSPYTNQCDPANPPPDVTAGRSEEHT